MRLLYVLPEYGPDIRGGIATYYANLLPALAQQGCRIQVVVAAEAPSGHPPTMEFDGVQVRFLERSNSDRAAIDFPHLAAAPNLQRALATAYAAWELCKQGENFDVIEVTDYALLFVPWIAAGRKAPLVVQLHGSSGQVDFYDCVGSHVLSGTIARLLESALLGHADELQSYGAPNGREWSARLGREVHHLWPAWSMQLGQRSSIPKAGQRAEFGLVVGRIQAWKGPDILCRALALLSTEAPIIKWIGRDTEHRRSSTALQMKARHPEVWGRYLIPAGEASPAQVRLLQQSARFVVVPSLWDTFNLSAVESLSAGRVVICSDGAGVAGLIENGVNGFSFAKHDYHELASLIKHVAQLSDEEAQQIGLRGRATVERMLSADTIAGERMQRYNSLKTSGFINEAASWSRPIFAASEVASPNAFLEQIPTRVLLKHSVQRVGARIRAMMHKRNRTPLS